MSPPPVAAGLGLRQKVFLISLAIILVCMGVLDVYLSRALEASITQRTEEELRVRLSLVEKEASQLDEPTSDAHGFDALADDLGRRARSRVTFISEAGAVMGDSEVELSALPRVENHADRPEVLSARATGHGSIVRLSPTTGVRMMYAAVPFVAKRGGACVARVAVPLDEVDRAIGAARRLLLIATVIAAGVAVVLSSVAAQLGSAPARRLIEAAKRMAEGDLSTRTHPVGTDELSNLGRALDQLASSLSATLGELKSERDLVQGILQGMQEGVLLLDADGRVVLVNPALRGMLLLGADVTGKTLLESVRHAELKALLDEARSRGDDTVGEVELSGLKPRRLLVRASPQRDKLRGLLAVFVDVTDVRRLESLRRDFVSNASHELRTPVSSILSAAETLRDVALRDPDASPRFVDIIVRNAERLRRLVDDLLDLSRIESREFSLTPEDGDVSVVVQHVLGLFRERAEKKGIRLAQAVPGAPVHARFDRRALETVLSNLVDNAVKYCPEGASVTVRAAEESGVVRMAVEDTGQGIEGRHLPRLFERFYRVDAGRSREVGGTGLGLSIVKHLVEAMGGTIGIESAVGRGTAFRFTLPRPAPGDATSSPPSLGQPG